MANAEKLNPRATQTDTVNQRHNRLTPAENQPSTQPLETRILKNFYLSFKFSQGEPEIQRQLFYALNHMYDKEEFRRSFISVHDLSEKLSPKLKKIHLPAYHTEVYRSKVEIPPEDVVTELQEQWHNQETAFEHLLDEGTFHPYPPMYSTYSQPVLRKTIAERMTKKDIYYMIYGRPNTGTRHEDNESMVKKYIIDKQSTGSREFDTLFSMLHEITIEALQPDSETSDLSDALKEFKAIWEASHPKEKLTNASQLNHA